jgi:type IV pilus assembly protein PilE
MRKAKGFTLIELMAVVIIIAILAAIAYPSYRDYILRGKITEAFSSLSELRLRAEKWFADNRTYVGFSTTINGARYFAYTCPTITATAFTCQADGVASQGMSGFQYTINESNVRQTVSVPSGWNTSTTCWITKKGETC